MNQVQKLQQKVGPMAQRIHENPPHQSCGSFRVLAELLWEFYQNYEKQLEVQELVEKSKKNMAKQKIEGGDNNE